MGLLDIYSTAFLWQIYIEKVTTTPFGIHILIVAFGDEIHSAWSILCLCGITLINENSLAVILLVMRVGHIKTFSLHFDLLIRVASECFSLNAFFLGGFSFIRWGCRILWLFALFMIISYFYSSYLLYKLFKSIFHQSCQDSPSNLRVSYIQDLHEPSLQQSAHDSCILIYIYIIYIYLELQDPGNSQGLWEYTVYSGNTRCIWFFSVFPLTTLPFQSDKFCSSWAAIPFGRMSETQLHRSEVSPQRQS